MDGRTDRRTNERYGEIRSGTVGGPSRLAEHPLFTEQSRSGHLLQLPHSLFVSSFRLFFATFSIYLTLPTSTLLPRRGTLNFSPASLLLLPLPFFSSPSFHCIFVASFSPHHSLAVILHHFPAVLTSRFTALHPDVGRVHGTPRCQHTIQLLSTTPAADTASIYITSPTTTDFYVYVCWTLMLVSFGPYELWDETGSKSERRAQPSTRSNLGRGSLPSLLSFPLSSPDSTSTCAFPW